MTSVISFDEAADALVLGQIGVIPTDTVYGIVAKASDEAAVKRLYAAKHREHKPGTIIAADIDQLVGLGLTKRYMTPVDVYWPGPVSVVVPAIGTELEYLHMGKQSLAVRIPDDTELLVVLRRTGPLLTSSANPPGEPVAVTVEQAISYFGNACDFYVDGGNRSGAAPSTVIRVVDDAIEVLREGAVTIDNQDS